MLNHPHDGDRIKTAARREFQEELGIPARGTFTELRPVKQKSGKIVQAWAFEGDCDPAKMISNYCEVEWPPRSGRLIEIPEADRGAWFSINEAKDFIKSTQIPLIDRLVKALSSLD